MRMDTDAEPNKLRGCWNMGFRQSIIVSSQLDKKAISTAIQSAASKWPFLRSPKESNFYHERLVLGLPELTEYLNDNDSDYESALEQNEIVELGLINWTKEFPNLYLCYIEADCFGGFCECSGFACQDGSEIERVICKQEGHIALLKHVGITTEGYYEPFRRGFFM